MIAGFEEPDEGEILLDGTDLTRVPPHKRPVNTVFQSYALFPFLTVSENVAFGLRYQTPQQGRGSSRVARHSNSSRWARSANANPTSSPAVNSNASHSPAPSCSSRRSCCSMSHSAPLTLVSAASLQTELRALHDRVGTTFIYVTHDQEEALTMSDRLAVLVNGRVEQVGTPSEVYGAPESAYVATFLGNANLFPATLDGVCAPGVTAYRIGDHQLCVDGEPVTGDVKLMVRPERVELAPPSPGLDGLNVFPAVVRTLTYQGARTSVRSAAGSLVVEAEVPNIHGAAPDWLCVDGPVSLRISSSALRVLPA